MVEKIQLNNGVEIPSVGLGVFRIEDNKEAQRVVETALAVGYRHVDTAMIYQNEEAVGKAIKASGIPREEIFVTTKLWNADQREGKVKEALEASLKKLGTDYIDLYLIHWPVANKIQDAWKKMEQLYNSGKIRAIGVSNFKAHHLDKLKEVSDFVPAVNQIELHPYLIQQADLNYCNRAGIRVEAWSPFAANKTDLFEERILIALADKYAKTPAQVILRWDYQRGVIVIPKSANENRMRENLDIFDFSLSDDEVVLINSLNKDKRVGADPDNFDF